METDSLAGKRIYSDETLKKKTLNGVFAQEIQEVFDPKTWRYLEQVLEKRNRRNNVSSACTGFKDEIQYKYSSDRTIGLSRVQAV